MSGQRERPAPFGADRREVFRRISKHAHFSLKCIISVKLTGGDSTPDHARYPFTMGPGSQRY